MKKNCLLLVLAIIFSAYAHAQVEAGIKLGANLYNFLGEDSKPAIGDKNLKPGIVAGVFTDIRLAKLFSVQPGLLYSEEGSIHKNGEDKITYKMNYLNLPLMLKCNLPSGFFGEIGPQVGYLLSAKVTTEVGDITITNKMADAKEVVFSGNIGCGWKFKNGLGINARSQWAFSNSIEKVKVRNNGFYASVFYQFKLQK
ncbi:MAG: PorT family protein [Rhizobacter sp.]|nr:PorT family protein [Ferruginibacter sp.]